MIVRCLTQHLSAEQVFRLGKGFTDASFEKLVVGDAYVVLGLQFEQQSLIWGTGPWIKIAVGDDGEPFAAPLCLFEVIDGAVSAHWDARIWEDGSVTLWPPSFYTDYYFNDLQAGKPAALDDYRQVCQLLEAEAEALSQ